MRLVNGVCLALAATAAVTLTACGSTAAPPATGSATRPISGIPGPPARSRAEAAALARLLLSRLPLPSGASHLPQTPLPSSLSEPAVRSATDTAAYLDQYRLFALAQPMAAAAAFLAAHVPPGLSAGSTGQGSGPDGITMQEVGYLARSVPVGIASAQLVLTIVPGSAGGSLLRADAQVIWYPSRSAAEYIDPARYHVLSLVVTIFGRNPHTVRRVVTSEAFIARLAETLDRSQAAPTAMVVCPADFEDYQLSFSLSGSSRPAVTVWANETGCGGAQVAVDGHSQPSLADYGAVGALVRQVVPVTPEI